MIQQQLPHLALLRSVFSRKLFRMSESAKPFSAASSLALAFLAMSEPGNASAVPEQQPGQLGVCWTSDSASPTRSSDHCNFYTGVWLTLIAKRSQGSC